MATEEAREKFARAAFGNQMFSFFSPLSASGCYLKRWTTCRLWKQGDQSHGVSSSEWTLRLRGPKRGRTGR